MKGEANYELVDAVAEDSDSDIEEDKGDTFDVRELLRSSSSINDDERKKKKMVWYIYLLYVDIHIYPYDIPAETQGRVGQNRVGLRALETET